jgi:hypothetical protein
MANVSARLLPSTGSFCAAAASSASFDVHSTNSTSPPRILSTMPLDIGVRLASCLTSVPGPASSNSTPSAKLR